MIESPLAPRQGAIARGADGLARRSDPLRAAFRLGAELFAVDTSAVEEIGLMAGLSLPSGLPLVIAGFLNLA